jgi:hypothetical protein
MPIPPFSSSGVLPPFVGDDPTQLSARSPYQVSMDELVDSFCTSRDRGRLLIGLNEYRKLLFSGGFTTGFQWIDGSFVENAEVTRGRSPRDIDLVTLFHRPMRYQIDRSSWNLDYAATIKRTYFDQKTIKATFACDAYPVDLDSGVNSLIRNVTYWFGLFTDVRGESGKKGVLQVRLPSDTAEFSHVERAIRGKYDV